MRELTVPKRRVEVEVSFTGGERRTFVLFLSEQAPDHAGPERVSDVLCREEAFFPALDPATGEMSFVARAAVEAVRVPRDQEPGDADELTIPTEHEVELALEGGARVRGTVSYVLPPERSRVVDYLNQAPDFFRVFTSPADVLLVARRRVSRVLLVSR